MESGATRAARMYKGPLGTKLLPTEMRFDFVIKQRKFKSPCNKPEGVTNLDHVTLE